MEAARSTGATPPQPPQPLLARDTDLLAILRAPIPGSAEDLLGAAPGSAAAKRRRTAPPAAASGQRRGAAAAAARVFAAGQRVWCRRADRGGMLWPAMVEHAPSAHQARLKVRWYGGGRGEPARVAVDAGANFAQQSLLQRRALAQQQRSPPGLRAAIDEAMRSGGTTAAPVRIGPQTRLLALDARSRVPMKLRETMVRKLLPLLAKALGQPEHGAAVVSAARKRERALYELSASKQDYKSRAGMVIREAGQPPAPPSAATVRVGKLLRPTDAVTCEEIEMSPTAMVAGGYPDFRSPPEGYVSTRALAAVGGGDSGGSLAVQVFGVDCEMCETAPNHNELTRVSIVDAEMTTVLDMLCIPDANITNYNTQWSGITAKLLEGVTAKLADVQRAVLALIDGGAWMVGHGLENDLHAMKICHSHVIDTAISFPHPRANSISSRWAGKYRLKDLAAIYLGETIQDDAAGHDSTEDAVAALQLALLKLRYGEDTVALSNAKLKKKPKPAAT